MSTSQAAADAMIFRIRTQNLDLLETYGATRLLEAINDRAESLNDLEEIGTSDVSCWVLDVRARLMSEDQQQPQLDSVLGNQDWMVRLNRLTVR